MAAPTAPSPASPARAPRRTELATFPSGARRLACLAIVVVATIVLYYQFYLAGAVASGTKGTNGILPDYNISFVFYVNIAVAGYVLGAIASFVSGIADKVGRVNIITIGLVVVALLCLVGIPLADSKSGFAVVFAAIGLVEGVILVATPALIRDFSPQLGRASAMGFWTLGPVLGSLIVSIQISSTSNSTPWHHQYIAAGIVGLVIAALSLLFLRELTPQLRDQLQVSQRDRVLIEARAAGVDVEASLRSPFKQMLKPDIVLSAFAISVFLIIYYIAVGFFPVFFQTVFEYSQNKANAIGNWVWAFDAGALLVIGYLSDKVRVRKPFMIIGSIGAIVMTSIFAILSTHAGTSYSTFVLVLSLLAVFLGVAYAPWMASFTETVEKRNPALTATGLAIWGLVIRIVIAIVVFIAPHIVNTVSTLVEHGPQAQALAAKYAGPIGATSKVDAATLAALQKNPDDQAAGVKAISEITGYPAADVATVATVNATHGAALKAAQKVDAATLAKLAADPTDQASGIKAVSEISGVSIADVTTIATLNAQYGTQLQNAQKIDAATVAQLLGNPGSAALRAQAVSQMVAKGVSQADAVATLQTLATIAAQPNGLQQLLLLSTNGTKVLTAQSQLEDLAKIPAAQLALVRKDGPNIAKAQANLVAAASIPATDQALLKKVQKAAHDSPRQWRTYFWIAVGGQVVFIPLIWLLVGYWSPRRARRAEEEHEAMIERELAKLRS